MLRNSRSTLRKMLNGSRPSADSTTPTRIDSRISRTSDRRAAGRPESDSRAPLMANPLRYAPTYRGSGSRQAVRSASRVSAARLRPRDSIPVRSIRRSSFSSVSSRSASRGRLVPAQAADAGKAHRDAGPVAGRALQALERDLEAPGPGPASCTTSRTGPKRSTVLWRTKRSICCSSSSVKPK